MRDGDVVAVVAIFAVLAMAFIALLAGNITNQFFAPIPSVGGPLGAAVALIVFVFLLGKSLALIIDRL